MEFIGDHLCGYTVLILAYYQTSVGPKAKIHLWDKIHSENFDELL